VGSQTLTFPQRIFKHFKCESVFLEGPEDDSTRIETCCLSTIIHVIKVLSCLTDTSLYIYIGYIFAQKGTNLPVDLPLTSLKTWIISNTAVGTWNPKHCVFITNTDQSTLFMAAIASCPDDHRKDKNTLCVGNGKIGDIYIYIYTITTGP